jgi:type VI protein secretion system component Hcp
MNNLRPFVLAGVLASAAQTAAAAASIFLLIPGVPGESTDSRHANWINLYSMQVGVANKVCSGVTVTKDLDRASPDLSGAALVGGAYPSMTLEVAKTGGDQQTYLTYALANVTVTSVSSSTGGDRVVEAVTLYPTTLTMSYKPQLSDGSLGAPVTYTLHCTKK